MEHELKIWPTHYERVRNKSKTFEIRDTHDRDFQSGDTVVLREWDPTPINKANDAPKGYTDSPKLHFKIGHVHYLPKGDQVVLSILDLKVLKN